MSVSPVGVHGAAGYVAGTQQGDLATDARELYQKQNGGGKMGLHNKTLRIFNI